MEYKCVRLSLILILVLAPLAISGQEILFPSSIQHPPNEIYIFEFSDQYKNKARDYLYEGNLNMMEACISIQEMLNTARDPILNGDIENQKGVIEYYKNNSTSALRYYLKALDYFSITDYRGGINSIMNNIAIIFNHIEDYESTRKYLVKAIEYTPEEDINSRSIYLLNLAETESQMDNCSVGVRIANELLEEYDPARVLFSELSIYGVLISCYNKMGMETEADEWIARGSMAINENTTYFDKFAFYSQAVKYYFDTKDYEKVIEFGSYIYPPADTTFMRDMYEPINCMTIAAMELGKLELASELDKVANRIEYSKETLEREDLINPLMEEYSFYRDIANRDLARIQLTENHKTERVQRKLLASLLLVMLAMIILIPILVRIRKLRNRLRLELAEKNRILEEINSQLDHDNQELEKGNNILDTFISVFAHDLINPFQAIIGFSQLMRTDHDALKDEDFIEYSELLSDTSFQLNQLLTNLKSLSLTQDDPEKIQSSKVIVKEIVDKVLSLFDSTRKKKNINIELEKVKKDCIGYINTEILESALRNMVSNAIKFSEPDSKIIISCAKVENLVELRIKDQGIGITREVLDSIQNKKYAQSKPGTSHEKGSGIGLAISIELLELFNSSLDINSEPGKGTEVIIKIPTWNE